MTSSNVSLTDPPLLHRTTFDPDDDGIQENFPRTAKWCGDGSSLLIQSENRSFQTFAYASPLQLGASTTAPILTHADTFTQSAPIIDFAWFPGASQHNPAAFCFVASVRDCPVKLLDAGCGRLRASYPIVDHRERFIAPHSLAFNLTVDKLYCGFEDAIEVFDVQRPGEGERLPTTPSKKSKDGLKGIISALAFSYSPEYYAAGTLTPASRVSDNIALFNESTRGPVLSIGGVAEREKGGVTQLMFNPSRPHVLYAAFRRSESLWSWDLRGDGSLPLCCFSRRADASSRNMTNQKFRFDVDSTGRWLASGNQTGEIVMHDLGIGLDEGEHAEETRRTQPALSYDAHDDAVGAVTFHPLEPFLLSVSGSRYFDASPRASTSENSGSESESSDESTDGFVAVKRAKEPPRPTVREASIKMWDFRTLHETGTMSVC